jgi:NAD(P)-dependent dehydrogenase (short-subunit alcohol dehydrogenase family)
MKEFDGKVAIITGTTGIGRAIAKRFAADGANVLACGIEVAANQELALDAQNNRLSLRVEQCDVTQADAVGKVVAKAVREFGGLDVIVNAAAFHPFGTVVETDLENWNRCLIVNVGSIYLLGHFGIPEMKKRGGGSIINLASVQGHACQRGVAAYAASKGAVHSLTRAMALDHAADKIRVNSISPGSIRTPMLERSAGHFSPGVPTEEVLRRFGDAHPLGRIGTPEEVAELAAFLASDRAAFCTGGDYLVDGGLLAGIGVQ